MSQPVLSQSPSPEWCPAPCAGVAPVPRLPCSSLGAGWALAAHPALTDPHRQPIQVPDTGRFKRVVLGTFTPGRYSMLVKLLLSLLFDYLRILYCLLYPLQGNFMSIQLKLLSAPSPVLNSLFKLSIPKHIPAFLQSVSIS